MNVSNQLYVCSAREALSEASTLADEMGLAETSKTIFGSHCPGRPVSRHRVRGQIVLYKTLASSFLVLNELASTSLSAFPCLASCGGRSIVDQGKADQNRISSKSFDGFGFVKNPPKGPHFFRISKGLKPSFPSPPLK